MAISAIIFKSSPAAQGEAWMDVRQKTVTAEHLEQDYTALKNDGTDIVGTLTPGGTPTLIEKSITANGTYSAQDDDADGYSSVTVSVSGGTPRTSTDLVVSGATVTAPAGVYAQDASKSVASGSEGTPTATKGAVSNHSVAVTPSVTNGAGYISGGTKSGTAVTVTAAELESGTKSITANGTGIDVSGYSAVDVAVPSGGGGMNVQAYIGQTTKANQAYEATDLTLTVAKTGTYKVSWDGCRSSTSGTNGSRLYINSTAQTAYTTFDSTNTRWQHVEMTNVSLTANDVITVYCRARSASYYMTVANLVIVQTA